MSDRQDIGPDSGEAPRFTKAKPLPGKIGTGSGYSGQEYDSVGQEEWRVADRKGRVDPDGEVRGSGSPAEEIDPNTPGSNTNQA